MNTSRRALRIVGLVGGLAWAWSAAACVSSSTYEAARLEAKRAKVQLLNERRKVAALEGQNKQLARRVDEWVDKLWHATERVEGVAQNWRDLRDELIRLRIDRELQRQREQNEMTGAAMQLELDPDQPKAPTAKPKPTQSLEPLIAIQPQMAGPEQAPESAAPPAAETKRRLKVLMEELGKLLEK